MARPLKLNADYFAHDANLRNSREIKALRLKYKLMGYAVYCMLLEILTDSDNFEMQLTELDLELIAGDIGIDTGTLSEIIDYCKIIKLFEVSESGMLFSESLKTSLDPVVSKRKINQKNGTQGGRPANDQDDNTPPKQSDSGVSATETNPKEQNESETDAETNQAASYQKPKRKEKKRDIIINSNNNYTPEFLEFLKYCETEAPELLKMQHPMTDVQYHKLLKEHSPQKIREYASMMSNYKKLHQTSMYAYLTMKNWMNRDLNKNTPKNDTTPIRAGF